MKKILVYLLMIFLSFSLSAQTGTKYFNPSWTGTTTGDSASPYNDFKSIIGDIGNFDNLTVIIMDDWDLSVSSTWTNRPVAQHNSSIVGSINGDTLLNSDNTDSITLRGNIGNEIISHPDNSSTNAVYTLHFQEFVSVAVEDLIIKRTKTVPGPLGGRGGSAIQFYDVDGGSINNCRIEATGKDLGAAIFLYESNNIIINDNTIINDASDWDGHQHAFYFRRSSNNEIKDCTIIYKSLFAIGPPVTFKDQSNNNEVVRCEFLADSTTSGSGITSGSVLTGYHNPSASPSELASTNNRIADCNSELEIGETAHTIDLTIIEYAFWEEWKVNDPIAGADPAYIGTTNTFSNFDTTGDDHTQLLKVDLSNASGFTSSYNTTTNVYEIACSDNQPRKVTVTITDLHDTPVAGITGNTTHEIENWVVETVDIISNDFFVKGNGEDANFSNDRGEDMFLYFSSGSVPITTISDNSSYFLSSNILYRVEVDLSSGFGTATVKPQEIISKTAEEPQQEAPIKNVELLKNYPNPFNPTTTIRYSIGSTQFVDLTVYDISGRRIKTLSRGTQNAGDYTLVWDSTNNKGEKVATGIYIYQLRTNTFTQSKKMFLIR